MSKMTDVSLLAGNEVPDREGTPEPGWRSDCFADLIRQTGSINTALEAHDEY